MLSEFQAFLLKTNALALAVGVIIGTALGAVVTSLVNDIIMPPIGLALGRSGLLAVQDRPSIRIGDLPRKSPSATARSSTW